jgi:hypothetical protein
VSEPSSLHAKVAKVITATVEGVTKDGRNTFHGYDYTTAETILRAIRDPLAENGLALMPSLDSIEERTIKTAKGGESTITTVWVTFKLVDSETGQEAEMRWAGQGDDPADKGLGKAYTNAIKTFLREQFLLPQGDDPEADKRTDERAAERVGGSNGQTQRRSSNSGTKASDGQVKLMAVKAKQAGLTDVNRDLLLRNRFGIERLDEMPHSRVNEWLEAVKQPIPTGESDIPVEAPEPPAAGALGQSVPF